jgi:hypothetical protein
VLARETGAFTQPEWFRPVRSNRVLRLVDSDMLKHPVKEDA